MKETWQIFEEVVNNRLVKHILLYGPPGTGKTSKACKTVKKGNFYNITLNEESSVSEILGMWVPKGKEFVWSDGVAIRAWKEGKLLVINEIDSASGAVLKELHAILDDIHMAKLTLPSGDTVRPKKGFNVIATMNGSVQDLPEALADRFELKLNITTPHNDLVELIPEDLRNLLHNAYSSHTLSISFREILSYSKLRETLGDDAFIVFGKLADDVRAVLKLGERDKGLDKPDSDVTDVTPDHDDSVHGVPDSSGSKSMTRFKRYWDHTYYEDMELLRFQKLASNAGASSAIFAQITEAFDWQKSMPDVFETKMEEIHQTILKTYSGYV